MKTEVFKKIDLRTRQLVNTLFLGNYQAAFKWRGLEFSDFREYVDGDDVKHIDWLISSRENKTMVRRYREERELEVLFVLDSGLSMFFWEDQQKIDTLREIFYILGFSAVQNGDKVGAFILQGKDHRFIPYKKGNTNLLKVFQHIPTKPPHTINKTLYLDFLNKRTFRKSLLFLVTDSLDIDETSLKISALKHDIIFIHISDDFENTLEGSGVHVLKEGKTQISIDLDNTRKKQQYIEMRKKKIATLKQKLLGYKIDSIFISNSDNPYKKILQLMKHREI